MLTPRELEVLDVVGEVMQERLQEVRKEYEGKLTDLQTKVAALEARPMALRAFPDDIRLELAPLTAKVAEIDERLSMVPLPITEEINGLRQNLTDKIAALESRAPEVTVETLRKMGDDLEEVIERRLAMIPPPPDLTPINVKIAAWDEQPSPATVLQMAKTAVAEGQADIIGRLESKIDVVVLDVAKRFEALPPPIDLAPLEEKIATLEAREPEVTAKTFGDLRDTFADLEGCFTALPPPADLVPLTEKVAALEERASEFATKKPDRIEVMRELSDAIAALPAPPDLAPLTEKIAALETTSNVDHINLDSVHARVMALEEKPPLDLATPLAELQATIEQRFAALPPPPDLTPLAAIVDDELRKRPTAEEVLKLAEGALNSTRASMIETLQISMIDLFKSLPIPEKGDKGEPGINGTSVTAEQFRDMFEASYAKFELDTERRIMDLVQRTLDRIPVPQDGKDGVGFNDLNIVRDGRKIRHEYLRDGEVVKTFEYKSDDLQYRDVYRTGTAYERGDVVTWGGSSWVAMRDAPTGRPGVPGKPDSGDWQLLVKEGRRGRSAYDLAVGKGFVGTEADWLASLKGPPGKDAKPPRPNGTMLGS